MFPISMFQRLCGALFLCLVSVSCVDSFKTLEESAQKSSVASNVDIWAQAEVSNSAEPAAGAMSGSCSIYLPAVLERDQEFRVVVMSRNVSQVQVSVANNAFFDIGTKNGTLKWPGNSFAPAEYHLRFRAIKTDGTVTICDPSLKIVTVSDSRGGPTPNPNPSPSPSPTPPVIPVPTTPPPTGGGGQPSQPPPSTGGGSSAIDRSYVALTGYSYPGSGAPAVTNSGFKNFKEIYKPDASMLIEMGSTGAPGEKCYKLRTRHGSNLNGITKFRVYLPPGTKQFGISTLTYYDQSTEQAAAYRFDAPPISTYEVAGNDSVFWNTDTKRNLEHVYSGKEYSGRMGIGGNIMPSFGTVSGSDYLNRYSFKTTRGGWLYINFLRIIGQGPLNMDTGVCVDPVAYEQWYNSAQWDQDGNPI